MTILTNIKNNVRVWGMYSRRNCMKFISVSKALKALDDRVDDCVLIFISELQLYGLFTLEEYLFFTKHLGEIYEEDPNAKSSTYQVILNTSQQKLVFMSTHYDKNNDATNTIEKISGYVKDFFGASIHASENEHGVEITVNKIVDGSARHELFDDLFNYIYQRDSITANRISILKTHRKNDYRYTTPKLDSVPDMDKLLLILKTLPNVAIHAPINIAINGGTINNVTGKLNYNSNHKPSAPETARKWIIENPPIHGKQVITTDYYKNYVDANLGMELVGISEFGKLVRSITGMTPVQGTGGKRYWRRV